MKLTCVVDNTVHPGTPFWGEHGVSFLIESEEGRVLLDTAASGTVLLHNLELLEVAPDTIGAVVLSHAHPDHTGGLEALLRGRRAGLPIYAHPDIGRERFSRRDGHMTARGLPVDLEVLRQQADLRLSDAPKEIVPGVWTTGGIAERREPEGRSSQHFVRDGEGWMPDPYRDDMSLVLDIPDGLVLVCGCCHAGLLNTLSQVRQTFGRHPVAVVGGTHLISADEGHLRHLVEVLERLGPPALYLNHCTGQTAYVALARAFGDRVAPCPAGTVLEF
jgi:7,8-dihydropterin-6-yl-methyl-4-(beta-D-ribofuranosyl)aminobenzene 5'-phosphate synthase